MYIPNLKVRTLLIVCIMGAAHMIDNPVIHFVSERQSCNIRTLGTPAVVTDMPLL